MPDHTIWNKFNDQSAGCLLGDIPVHPVGIIGQSGLTYGVIPTEGKDKGQIKPLFCPDENGFGKISKLHFFPSPISSLFNIEVSYNYTIEELSLAGGFFCIPQKRKGAIFLNLLFPISCSLFQIHTYTLSVDITPKIMPANSLIEYLPQLEINMIKDRWVIVSTKKLDIPRIHRCSTTKECMLPVCSLSTTWCVVDLKPENKIMIGPEYGPLRAQYLLQ